MSFLFSCGNSCGTTVPTCANPYSLCPTVSIVTTLVVTNKLSCPVTLCLTLSDSTTQSIIIPGAATDVTVGPYTSGAGVTLTITFLQAVVLSGTCNTVWPLYYNTLPQNDTTTVTMIISATGAVTFT